MKQKRFVLVYGKVVHPVIRGMKARYFSNGSWKETAKVKRVVEMTEEHIKFETDRIRYHIEYGQEQVVAMSVAA